MASCLPARMLRDCLLTAIFVEPKYWRELTLPGGAAGGGWVLGGCGRLVAIGRRVRNRVWEVCSFGVTPGESGC